MILFITSDEHTYTHTSLVEESDRDVRVVTYSELQKKASTLPEATYIFTDVDRLDLATARQMSAYYRALRKHGQKVLNDPARMLGRFGLLRALNRAGINDFDAYRVDSLETPKRWPVFLRTEGGHGQPVSDLLNNQDELDAALEDCVERGLLKSALLIIEYCAEPVRPGLFRKLSVFRLGDRMLGYTCVHDDQWVVKYGQRGVATPELYEEEYEFVSTNPYGELLRQVFDIAGMEYGRADFGLVGGRPQIYEINSNPDLKLTPKKPSPVERRNESNALFRGSFLEALREIDSPQQPGEVRAANTAAI